MARPTVSAAEPTTSEVYVDQEGETERKYVSLYRHEDTDSGQGMKSGKTDLQMMNGQ